MPSRRPLLLAALGALFALAVAPGPAGAATKHRAHAHPPPPSIEVVNTANGPLLTNGQGQTLYVYTPDLAVTNGSACTGDCLHDWPPALVQGKIVLGSGISGTIGTIPRGTALQFTIDNRPLYTFVGDRGRARIVGNGIGNIWWAMTPTGLSATSYPVLPSTTRTGHTTLTVVKSPYGPIVADTEGHAVYEYSIDPPGGSACQAQWCLVDWPPLQAKGVPTAAPGISAPVGTITGAGGLTQVTLGGHPLYDFEGDLRVAQTDGQAVGNDWFLMSPDGTPITTTITTHGGIPK